MTNNQNYRLSQAIEKIKEARKILDDVMYRSEPVSDAEHDHIRVSYELLCQSADNLYAKK